MPWHLGAEVWDTANGPVSSEPLFPTMTWSPVALWGIPGLHLLLASLHPWEGLRAWTWEAPALWTWPGWPGF